MLDRVGRDEPIDFLSGRDRLVDDDVKALAKAFSDDVEMPACRRRFVGDPWVHRDKTLVHLVKAPVVSL